MDDVLTTKEAAAFLKVSVGWLRQHEEVPRHRMPGKAGFRFLKSELLDYVERLMAMPFDKPGKVVYRRAV